jgi:hypothetical protein
LDEGGVSDGSGAVAEVLASSRVGRLDEEAEWSEDGPARPVHYRSLGARCLVWRRTQRLPSDGASRTAGTSPPAASAIPHSGAAAASSLTDGVALGDDELVRGPALRLG